MLFKGCRMSAGYGTAQGVGLDINTDRQVIKADATLLIGWPTYSLSDRSLTIWKYAIPAIRHCA